MSKTITIYGAISSPYVNRLVLGCKRKKINYELLMPEGGLKSKEFLKINPLGKIPTIKDGNKIIFESGVILEYLDNKYPKTRLIPKSINSATEVRLISAMWENYVVTMLIRLFVQAINPSPDRKKVISDTLNKLNGGLDAIEQYMTPQTFSVGKTFSLADCYAFSALTFLERVEQMLGLESLLGKRKKIKKLWKSIKKEKIVKEVLYDIKEFRKNQ